jgi:hypothetical protein
MAITRAETEDAWSSAHIVRFEPAELRALGLPEAARHPLVEFGLPDRVESLFASDRLARLELPRTGAAVRFGLGWNDEYQMCVRVDDGEVYAFHADADEVTYANKDMAAFIEFLARSSHIYQLYNRTERAEVSEGDYLDTVAEVSERLEACDPRALLDGGWWAGIVEEFSMI